MRKIDTANNLISALKSGESIQKILTEASKPNTFANDDYIPDGDWINGWQANLMLVLAENCIFSRKSMIDKLHHELAFDTLLNSRRAKTDKSRLNKIHQHPNIQFFNDDTGKLHDKPISKDNALDTLRWTKFWSFDKHGKGFCEPDPYAWQLSMRIDYLADKLNLVTDMPVHNNAEYVFKNQTLKDIAINLSNLSASYPDNKEDQDAEALADGDVDFVDNIADNKPRITKVRALSSEFDI